MFRTITRNIPTIYKHAFLSNIYRCCSSIKYSHTNEWIRISNKDKNLAKVGISNKAAKNLSDIVYVEIEENQGKLLQNEDFASLESIKAIVDIKMPVDGTITKLNQEVIYEPGILNESPESKGWIIEIELDENSMEQFKNLPNEDPDPELIQ
jgi:glycine cleavage system H protein